MTMNSLGGLSVGGDYNADVTLSTALVSSAFIDIAGEMASTAAIRLPASGLQGQITVNSAASGADAWDGDVVVGSTTLTATDDPDDDEAYYTDLSAELGGGAVGRAPFNFHQRRTSPGATARDCDPYQSEAVFVGPSYGDLDEVRIRHYGPVYVDTSGGGNAFRIEFKSDVLSSSWVDRSDYFIVDDTQTATDANAIAPHRDIYLTHDGTKGSTGFEAAGRWRIRPIAGKVKCADVTGNPDVRWVSNVVSGNLGAGSGTQYSWYAFRVFLEATSGGMLLQDANAPTADDISEWLLSPYEVNADGETDAQDFADLSAAYGD